MARASSRPAEVRSITTARLSHSDDLALRKRKYVYLMLGRIVCLSLAVIPAMPNWARIVLIAGMVLLPWGAVQIANAGSVVRRDGSSLLEDQLDGPRALSSSSASQHRVWEPGEDLAGQVLDLDEDGRLRDAPPAVRPTRAAG